MLLDLWAYSLFFSLSHTVEWFRKAELARVETPDSLQCGPEVSLAGVHLEPSGRLVLA